MSAYIVLVRTERLGGGKPLVGYFAAFGEAAEAVAAVKEQQEILDEEVVAVAPLSDATIQAIGLQQGQVIMV